jgi:membrane associated rhomboid family serine protease
MGIYDRDYYRQSLPRGGFGHFNAWSVTTWLIIINVAVFFIDASLSRATHAPPRDPYDDEDAPSVERLQRSREAAMFDAMGPLERWGYFSTDKAIHQLQIWRFVTFQFLHSSPMHLVFNMLGIYLFGPIVEAQFGSRRFTAFYLLCGLAGTASYLLLSATHILVIAPSTPMVGASAGIFGLLVAAALIAPDVQVFYYLFPVTIGMLAIFGMLMALYSVITLGYNAGGEAAHLGGGVLGFAIMKNQHWLHFFEPAQRRRQRATVPMTTASRRPRKRAAYQKDWSKDFNR